MMELGSLRHMIVGARMDIPHLPDVCGQSILFTPFAKRGGDVKLWCLLLYR